MLPFDFRKGFVYSALAPSHAYLPQVCQGARGVGGEAGPSGGPAANDPTAAGRGKHLIGTKDWTPGTCHVALSL